MVNPRADPPIIKMMMSERTPPTTEADSVQSAEADSVKGPCTSEISNKNMSTMWVCLCFAVCSILSPTLC